MEKRHKKTLARTLDWGSTCAKIGLTAVLFIPPILTVRYVVPRPDRGGPVQVAKWVEHDAA